MILPLFFEMELAYPNKKKNNNLKKMEILDKFGDIQCLQDISL